MTEADAETVPVLVDVTVPPVAELDPFGMAGAVHVVRTLRIGTSAEDVAVAVVSAYLAGCPPQ